MYVTFSYRCTNVTDLTLQPPLGILLHDCFNEQYVKIIEVLGLNLRFLRWRRVELGKAFNPFPLAVAISACSNLEELFVSDDDHIGTRFSNNLMGLSKLRKLFIRSPGCGFFVGHMFAGKKMANLEELDMEWGHFDYNGK